MLIDLDISEMAGWGVEQIGSMYSLVKTKGEELFCRTKEAIYPDLSLKSEFSRRVIEPLDTKYMREWDRGCLLLAARIAEVVGMAFCVALSISWFPTGGLLLKTVTVLTGLMSFSHLSQALKQTFMAIVALPEPSVSLYYAKELSQSLDSEIAANFFKVTGKTMDEVFDKITLEKLRKETRAASYERAIVVPLAECLLALERCEQLRRIYDDRKAYIGENILLSQEMAPIYREFLQARLDLAWKVFILTNPKEERTLEEIGVIPFSSAVVNSITGRDIVYFLHEETKQHLTQHQIAELPVIVIAEFLKKGTLKPLLEKSV